MVLTMLPQVTFGAVLGTGFEAHSNSESQPSANYLLRFPQVTLEIVAGWFQLHLSQFPSQEKQYCCSVMWKLQSASYLLSKWPHGET